MRFSDDRLLPLPRCNVLGATTMCSDRDGTYDAGLSSLALLGSLSITKAGV